MSLNPKNFVIIDNDECIVSAVFPSAFYAYIKINHPTALPHLKQSFIILLENGVLRPGVKQMFETIKAMKKKGIINKVVMYTLASNTNGWVDFLKELIEIYLDCKGIYDLVLHRNNVDHDSNFKYIDYVKKHFNEMNANILMFDDKPENIVGKAEICRVPPYSHLISREVWNEVLKDLWQRYKPEEDYKKSFIYKLVHGPYGYKSEKRMYTVYDIPENQLDDRHILKLVLNSLSKLT